MPNCTNMGFAAALLALPQDPEDEPDATEDPVLPGNFTSLREQINERMLKQMEGAWVLQHLDHVGSEVSDEDLFGFATIVDGYISIVVHGQDVQPDLPVPDIYFQASVSQFEFRQAGEILTSSLIGHSNFSGDFEFEPANFPRVFQVEVLEHDLTLVRDDGSRLIFRRLQPGGFPEAAQEILGELQQGGQ